MKFEDIKEIWIEAEQWSKELSVENQVSDVLVYTTEGKQWVGTFITSIKAKELMANWCENDSEKHLWVNEMIIIKSLDRIHIESEIKKMVEEKNFENIFSEYGDM